MKRCGGIGDILSGLTGLYISWCLQGKSDFKIIKIIKVP
jgi:NAD(P)H-hydrate repair Nnr-like enzyme with NAD(P)H-hydrate dehydratase domain